MARHAKQRLLLHERRPEQGRVEDGLVDVPCAATVAAAPRKRMSSLTPIDANPGMARIEMVTTVSGIRPAIPLLRMASPQAAPATGSQRRLPRARKRA